MSPQKNITLNILNKTYWCLLFITNSSWGYYLHSTETNSIETSKLFGGGGGGGSVLEKLTERKWLPSVKQTDTHTGLHILQLCVLHRKVERTCMQVTIMNGMSLIYDSWWVEDYIHFVYILLFRLYLYKCINFTEYVFKSPLCWMNTANLPNKGLWYNNNNKLKINQTWCNIAFIDLWSDVNSFYHFNFDLRIKWERSQKWLTGL